MNHASGYGGATWACGGEADGVRVEPALVEVAGLEVQGAEGAVEDVKAAPLGPEDLAPGHAAGQPLAVRLPPPDAVRHMLPLLTAHPHAPCPLLWSPCTALMSNPAQAALHQRSMC